MSHPLKLQPDWFSPIIPFIESDSVSALQGKFHAHLTVAITEDRVEMLRNLCKQEKVKLTIVDLENASGQEQTDVMTTSYYRDDSAGAVSRIADQLAGLSNVLNENGFKVIRAKLEHESLPSLPIFSEQNYHEVHVKLEIPESIYPATYQSLLTTGKEIGFVPSRNPLAKSGGDVIQFINLRIYSGSHADADDSVDAVLQSIADEPLKVVEIKRETIVFDTGKQLDKWWL